MACQRIAVIVEGEGEVAAVPVPGDCRAWLTAHRTDGGIYRQAVGQAALAAILDLQLARKHSPSFDKLWREVARLLGEEA